MLLLHREGEEIYLKVDLIKEEQINNNDASH